MLYLLGPLSIRIAYPQGINPENPLGMNKAGHEARLSLSPMWIKSLPGNPVARPIVLALLVARLLRLKRED